MSTNFSPKRVFELGAHDARAVMLDTIDRSFKQKIEVVALDKKAPAERVRELGAGDILFVDQMELAPIVLDVLPMLAAGVFVQLRPVHYPFRDAALLRAFLMYNKDFQIRFWPSYLHQHCRDRLAVLPQISADAGALWIRKVS